MADDENHARRRRALAHSFSQKALLEQEPNVNGDVDFLMNILARMSSKDEVFNMVNWLKLTRAFLLEL
jgi:cytochrome P450